MTEDRRVVALNFRPPTPPMSENEARGAHWTKVRDRTQPWRDAATYLARAALARGQFRILQGIVPITVQVDIPFKDNRRRDPHNYVGTVVKAVVDGLVRATIVPDDTADWVTVLDPILTVNPDGLATITITARERTP